MRAERYGLKVRPSFEQAANIKPKRINLPDLPHLRFFTSPAYQALYASQQEIETVSELQARKAVHDHLLKLAAQETEVPARYIQEVVSAVSRAEDMQTPSPRSPPSAGGPIVPRPPFLPPGPYGGGSMYASAEQTPRGGTAYASAEHSPMGTPMSATNVMQELVGQLAEAVGTIYAPIRRGGRQLNAFITFVRQSRDMPLYRGYSEPVIQIRQGGLELGRQGQARADVRDQEGIITMATQIQDEQRRRDASLLFGESTTRPEDALLLGLAGPVQRLSIRESIDRIARAGLVQNDVDQSLALEDLRHQQALEDIERIANAGRDVSNLMAREDSQHQRALQDMERGVVIALEDMDRASEGEEDRARAELMRKIDALRARLERPRSSSRRVIEAAQNTAAADQSGSANLMPPPPPPSRRRFPPAIARGRSREAAELRQVMSAASSTERGSEASQGSASSRGRSRRSIPLSLASELSAPSSSAKRGRPQSQSTASPNLDTPSEARRKRGRAP